MFAISFLFGLASQGAAPDPFRLPIGKPGSLVVQPNQIVDLQSAKVSRLEDVVRKAAGHHFVYVGESHTNPKHHQFQADLIEALCKSGRPVVVGFEMFQRPVQDELNVWTMGYETEEEFVQKSDWKHQWGLDFSLYKPIFEVTRKYRVPMVALNIPRAWVHSVGQKGFDGLTVEQRAALPNPLGILNPTHRKVFDAMVGGHPMSGAQNMYAAQVLWDEAMADSGLKYLATHPLPQDAVLVFIAGSGHVMYGQGINWRIAKRTGDIGITVVMVDGEKPVTVARGLGDFVYCGGTEK